MNFVMDRDARKAREEGAVVGPSWEQWGGGKKNKNEEGEILVASLERNSHQALVQIFLF